MKYMMKKIIALFMALLLASNVFAVTVSENDGAAFITKAEFDSLKNSFQNQINTYNTSIDSKIDAAIASYLAGITISSKSRLDNIYDTLGGSDIKWCWYTDANMIKPETEPKGALAIYYVNAYTDTSLWTGWPSASWNFISNATDDGYWCGTGSGHGGGTIGKFITYDINKKDNAKCFTNYKEAYVQNRAEGYWYTSGSYKDGTFDVEGVPTVVYHNQNFWYGMFGTSDTDYPTLNAGIQKYSTKIHVDCDLVFANERLVNKNETGYRRTDYSKYVCPWDVPTTANVVSITNENYKKPQKVDRNLGKGNMYDSRRGSDTQVKNEIGNVRVWNWETDKVSWTDMSPGFYSGKDYDAPKIYGGVHFFTNSGKEGDITVSDFKLLHESAGTNYVYFAISDKPFSNESTLKGTVTLTYKGSAEDNVTANKSYKIKHNVSTTIKFKAEKNKTYYIKIQPSTAKTDKSAYMVKGTTINIERN